MSSLLEELTNLEYQKEYSVVLNGIGSFIFVTKAKVKFENIKEEYQHLLGFQLIQQNYEDYQRTLQELVDIWINEK